jgi:hypothetical protein
MISAYEARSRHSGANTLRANPFDTGTGEWHAWRKGFSDALSCSKDSGWQRDAEKANA